METRPRGPSSPSPGLSRPSSWLRLATPQEATQGNPTQEPCPLPRNPYESKGLPTEPVPLTPKQGPASRARFLSQSKYPPPSRKDQHQLLSSDPQGSIVMSKVANTERGYSKDHAPDHQPLPFPGSTGLSRPLQFPLQASPGLSSPWPPFIMDPSKLYSTPYTDC